MTSEDLPQLAPDNWDELTTEEQDEHIHLLRGLKPDDVLSADAVFRAAVDSLKAESYDVEAGWQRFRTWMIDQGYVVPDDAPPFLRNPREDQGGPSHGTTHR